MERIMSSQTSLLIGLSALLFLVSCDAARMASYDPYAHQKSMEVRMKASKLIDKSIEPFENHAEEVENLLLEMDKVKTYEQNRSNNGISFRMWQLLADENRFSLAGFIKKWREKGRLSKTFVEESKQQIMEGIDLLIWFEGKKDAESKLRLENFISTTSNKFEYGF
nr:hypothetical protein [Allomuricauda sp.]